MKAKLDIEVGLKERKTYLKRCFYTTPFKIADVTEDKSQNLLRLMLMTSSPGILDGDEYDITIKLAEECSLRVETQSYQRLFNMKRGAWQRMEVNMSRGSSLSFLPHPSVPHKASIYVTRNKIYLSNDCKLLWGEILTCGRILNGEEFQFIKYHSITEVFLNRRLVIKDNLLVEPSVTNLSLIGQYEGFTHQACLLYLDEKADTSSLTEQLKDLLSGCEHILFGISNLPVNGLVIRLLGSRAEQLYQILKNIGALFENGGIKKIQRSAVNAS